jgi:hypothetical protein
VCVCVCITVHGLPLGAPLGRMGPVHRTLCNTIKRKICLSMRTPVHMRIYRNANMCLPRTGVGKTQKTNKNSGLSSQKGIFSFQTRQKLIMWPSYLFSLSLHRCPGKIAKFPVLVALALRPDLIATVHFEALPCRPVDRQDVLVPISSLI